MDPFDLFPVKVWEEILHRLENPLDKLSLIKTNQCLEMLDLFQECGDEWHFTAVLGILLDHIYRVNNRTDHCFEKHRHTKGELKSAFLNCRLVSKSVTRIVDNFVDLYWKKTFWFPPFTSFLNLHCLDHFDNCLAHADQLKHNRSISPFICGGFLDLDCGEDLHYDQDGNLVSYGLTFEETVQLVSHPNIGNNLRGLCLTVYLTVDEIQECNFLRKLLNFTPNLLNLSILFYPPEIEVEQVEIDKTPLPELPHLKILKLYEYNYYDTDKYPLLQHYLDFTQYSEQLTSFKTSLLLWKEEYKIVNFPKLKSLLFFNVPIPLKSQDWMNNLLEIIAKLNAPALEYLTLQTEDFDMEPKDTFFMNFLNEQFLCTLLRSNQKWTLDRDVEQFAGNFYCVYVFTRKFELDVNN